MGLGKTVEMISLILSNPRTDLAGLDPDRGHEHVDAWLKESWGEAPSPLLLPVKSTLIIVPKNLLEQWKDEIQRHAPTLSVKEYTRTVYAVGAWWNDERRIDYAARNFWDYDVVLTTYDQVTKQSLELETANFWRVVIDEAQSVRDEEKDLSARVSMVSRVNSWVVTGTPIYQGIGDLSGYFSFLGLDPFLDSAVY
ncbi:SNF2 family N-terminal domain-containing protein, partial [Hyaloraphidium curvatum]